MEKTIEEKFVETLNDTALVHMVRDYQAIIKGLAEYKTELEKVTTKLTVEYTLEMPDIMYTHTFEQAHARVIHTVMFLIYEKLALRYLESL